MVKTIQVWDVPIRLFHWGLVVAITVSVISIKTNLIDNQWHLYSGMAITALLSFRLCWGMIGSHTAQFRQFWPRLSALRAMLKHEWQGVGHSPTAALSVFALLGVLVWMIATGVCADDDISLQGPLAHWLVDWVDASVSDQASAWHAFTFNVMIGLVSLHLAAIAYYAWVKRNNLVPAMLHGKQQVTPALTDQYAQQTAHDHNHFYWRLSISVVIAAVITLVLFNTQVQSWLYAPPTVLVVPASTQAW